MFKNLYPDIIPNTVVLSWWEHPASRSAVGRKNTLEPGVVNTSVETSVSALVDFQLTSLIFRILKSITG